MAHYTHFLTEKTRALQTERKRGEERKERRKGEEGQGKARERGKRGLRKDVRRERVKHGIGIKEKDKHEKKALRRSKE